LDIIEQIQRTDKKIEEEVGFPIEPDDFLTIYEVGRGYG
jgi:hypothetical protein